MTIANAQDKMKAVLVSRLLLGDIGRSYRELSAETKKFISRNFVRCDYNDLARLCDAVKPGSGLYLPLDEFEKAFVPLAQSVKQRFPFYAHVSISVWGLRFEYPELHFLQDLAAGLDDLKETRLRLDALQVTDANMKGKRDDITPLISREKFISRSIVSASFSLVEAFLSGLFFTALNTNALGQLCCDEEFLRYAEKKESAALKGRLDRIVRFASLGKADGGSDPFKSFIEIGKRYRDAIHHTTPSGRNDLEAGQRLIALYEMQSNKAALCALLSLDCVLTISNWIYSDHDWSEIADSCKKLRENVVPWSTQQDRAG